jgi:hypothetical protein
MEGIVWCSSARKRVLFNKAKSAIGMAERALSYGNGALHHGRVILNLAESVVSMVEVTLRHGKEPLLLGRVLIVMEENA